MCQSCSDNPIKTTNLYRFLDCDEIGQSDSAHFEVQQLRVFSFLLCVTILNVFDIISWGFSLLLIGTQAVYNSLVISLNHSKGLKISSNVFASFLRSRFYKLSGVHKVRFCRRSTFSWRTFTEDVFPHDRRDAL